MSCSALAPRCLVCLHDSGPTKYVPRHNFKAEVTDCFRMCRCRPAGSLAMDHQRTCHTLWSSKLLITELTSTYYRGCRSNAYTYEDRCVTSFFFSCLNCSPLVNSRCVFTKTPGVCYGYSHGTLYIRVTSSVLSDKVQLSEARPLHLNLQALSEVHLRGREVDSGGFKKQARLEYSRRRSGRARDLVMKLCVVSSYT